MQHAQHEVAHTSVVPEVVVARHRERTETARDGAHARRDPAGAPVGKTPLRRGQLRASLRRRAIDDDEAKRSI
jgi:hypothetical protein